MQGFRSLAPEEIGDNTFKLIGTDWMLITAGTTTDYNTMTASWGGLGVLWGKPSAFIFVRPQRYTYSFLERYDNFTLSFFSEEWRDALSLCGSKSGRAIDKAAATGLRPMPGSLPGTTAFAEARLIVECRKIYFQDLDPNNFLSPDIAKNYPQKDYHRLYVGEISGCLVK